MGDDGSETLRGDARSEAGNDGPCGVLERGCLPEPGEGGRSVSGAGRRLVLDMMCRAHNMLSRDRRHNVPERDLIAGYWSPRVGHLDIALFVSLSPLDSHAKRYVLLWARSSETREAIRRYHIPR